MTEPIRVLIADDERLVRTQLLQGIRVVAGDHALLSPGLTRRLIAQLPDRTP
jgi:hypothetical protein